MGYFGALGIPLPEVVVPMTILLELGGGVALLVGWQARPIAVALGLFSVTGLLAHRSWSVEPAQFGNQMNHFLNNVGIAGGLVLIASIELQSRFKRPA